MTKYLRLKNLKGGNVYLAQFPRFQSIVAWQCGFGPVMRQNWAPLEEQSCLLHGGPEARESARGQDFNISFKGIPQ
jgi:hypothetical protein